MQSLGQATARRRGLRLFMSFDKAGLADGKCSEMDSGVDWGEAEAGFVLRRDEAVDTVLRARSIVSPAGWV